MSSEVSICNQAISWLGGNVIISLDDGTTEAILCKANYALLRDAVLEEGKWTFATRRFELLPNPTPPVYGYSHRFELPSDILNVIQVTNHRDNANDSNDYDHRVEEEFIVCNDSKIWVKAVIRVTDVQKFSPLFNQALASRIAADIAVPLTESQTKEARMLKKYNNALAVARATDGMQGKSDRIRTNSRIVKAR